MHLFTSLPHLSAVKSFGFYNLWWSQDVVTKLMDLTMGMVPKHKISKSDVHCLHSYVSHLLGYVERDRVICDGLVDKPKS